MWEVYGQMYQYSQSNLSPYIFGKTSCWFHSRYLGITQLHDTSPLPLAGARREHVLDDHPNSWVVSLIMDFPASCSIWKRVTTLKRWSKHEENPLFPLSYLVDPHKLPEFLSKMVLTKENRMTDERSKKTKQYQQKNNEFHHLVFSLRCQGTWRSNAYSRHSIDLTERTVNSIEKTHDDDLMILRTSANINMHNIP